MHTGLNIHMADLGNVNTVYLFKSVVDYLISNDIIDSTHITYINFDSPDDLSLIELEVLFRCGDISISQYKSLLSNISFLGVSSRQSLFYGVVDELDYILNKTKANILIFVGFDSMVLNNCKLSGTEEYISTATLKKYDAFAKQHNIIMLCSIQTCKRDGSTYHIGGTDPLFFEEVAKDGLIRHCSTVSSILAVPYSPSVYKHIKHSIGKKVVEEYIKLTRSGYTVVDYVEKKVERDTIYNYSFNFEELCDSIKSYVDNLEGNTCTSTELSILFDVNIRTMRRALGMLLAEFDIERVFIAGRYLYRSHSRSFEELLGLVMSNSTKK